MITISCNKKFIQEKKYVFHVILKEGLGLDFTINFSATKSPYYQFLLPNGKALKIRDCFFSKFDSVSDYLQKENLPENIIEFDLLNKEESSGIALYGQHGIVKEDDQISLEFDLISSAFFMLTRWEEFVIKIRDHHDRFLGKDSIAHKFGFLKRPIVNEYIEFLRILFNRVGLKIDSNHNKRKYKVIPTHDIDHPFKWKTSKDFVMWPLIGLKSGFPSPIKMGKRFFKEVYQSFYQKKYDAFDTFDFLMDQSEKIGTKSHFFFLVGQKNRKYDHSNPVQSKKFKSIIQNIQQRGHYIGLHPGYDTYIDEFEFRNQLRLLKDISGSSIYTGRQHYLKFRLPETWQIWEEAEMKWDSTLGYADIPGFRAGICNDFPVFNILTRRQLRLREFPLIAMEITPAAYYQMSPEKAFDKFMKELIKISHEIKKYNGQFVLLWHNNSLLEYRWKGFSNYYSKLLCAIA